MEGFYTATEHLGCFGDIGNIALSLGRKPLSYDVESIWTHSMVSPASLIFFAVPPEPSKRTPD